MDLFMIILFEVEGRFLIVYFCGLVGFEEVMRELLGKFDVFDVMIFLEFFFSV